MVPPSLRGLAVPGTAFALFLGAALAVLAASERDPRAGLYRAATRAVTIVEAGERPDAPELADWVEDRRGLLGQLADLEILPDGSEGRADVVWTDPDGRVRRLDALGFVRGAGGGWQLVGVRSKGVW